MDIFQLECFSMVAQTQSFSEAAHNLYISQSSISKQIAKLEEELHLQLFNRTKRTIELTVAGTEFYIHAQQLLKQYNHMITSMQQYSNQVSIHFGCIENIGKMGLTVPLSHYMKDHPNVQLSVKLDHTWNLLDFLCKRKINLAIINKVTSADGGSANTDGFDLSDFNSYTLNDDEYYAIINPSNPLSQRDFLHWEDLDNENILTFDSTYSLRTYIQQEFQKAGVAPAITFECNVVDNLLAMVSENAGISFMPRSISQTGYNVCSVPIVPAIKRNQVLLVEKKIADRKSVSAFVETILGFYNR